jgi:hypothetical protein
MVYLRGRTFKRPFSSTREKYGSACGRQRIGRSTRFCKRYCCRSKGPVIGWPCGVKGRWAGVGRVWVAYRGFRVTQRRAPGPAGTRAHRCRSSVGGCRPAWSTVVDATAPSFRYCSITDCGAKSSVRSRSGTSTHGTGYRTCGCMAKAAGRCADDHGRVVVL